MGATAAMEIGSDLWNARVYAGLAQASELAAGLDRPRRSVFSLFSALKIYWRFGRLNRELDDIFMGYDRPVPFPPVVPGERNRLGRDILLQLYKDCKGLKSPPEGVPLHGPIGKRLARLQTQSERLLDVADWLDAMSTPEEMNAKFDAAFADLASGDVVPWAAVQ
jgi:hypothetical protein